MKKTYKSLYGQMAYTAISGVQMLFIPNIMLAPYGFPPTQENWIRVMGLLVLGLLFYYYPITKSGNKDIIWGTIYGRCFFCTGLIIMGLMGVMPKAIILFGIFELALAFWTWREVRNE
jgi:hypothetical protein